MGRLTIVALALFIFSAALAGVAFVRAETSACDATNAGLSVTRDIAKTSYDGPHKFNGPADKARRKVTYNRELAEIAKARC